jgi:hypothetical protein
LPRLDADGSKRVHGLPRRFADARHRQGHEDYRAGIGFGGRYVPPEVIEAQADQQWGSINRRTFEQVKSWFPDWAVRGELTREEYDVLSEAAPEAGRTEDQGGA